MRRLLKMFNRGVRNILLTPFLIWAGLFIFIPLVCIVWYGVTDYDGNFSLANLGLAFKHGYIDALKLSIVLALISTVICLLLAYPLCLILTERQRDNTTIISLLFILPLWMNSLLSTMAWQTILEGNGIINQLMRLLSLPDLQLINTPGAIVLGMVYNYLPYMVLPLYISLTKIDRRILEAARDLGANSWQTFTKIILPLSIPGAISGITMVFIPALTTFVISALLGGGKLLLIGNIIEQEFTFQYDWHVGCALSVILMVFIVLNMLLTAAFERKEEEP
ncbi:MAG: ABC transporter permease [Selenomonadaceae bacterium]|nr:ABC transporter permease [Selenomonadaceae bacterium]